jgi:hypothetical protein
VQRTAVPENTYLSLFTGVRGIGILRTSRVAPLYQG